MKISVSHFVWMSGLLASSAFAGGTLDASCFGAFPDDGKDDTYAVRLAVEQAKKQGADKLVFPKGRYDFYPDKAFERYQFTNNAIEKTEAYPQWKPDAPRYITADCEGIKIQP